MRYDREQNKILISVRELVAIARRGISPTLPADEDEPGQTAPNERMVCHILGKVSAVSLSLGFETLGHSFTLFGSCESATGANVTIVRRVEYSLKRIKRADEEKVRGEGFILSYMQAMEQGLKTITLKTVYVSGTDGETIEKEENIALNKLKSFFEKCTAAVARYAEPEIQRICERLPSMRALSFPYSEAREGQNEFIRAAYRNIARGTTLIAAAPTGTGKTVSAMFPAIRALGDERVTKVFYLTPKTTTREAACDCLRLMADEGAIIRAVTLISKEKACEGGLICREDRKKCIRSKENKLADAVFELYKKAVTVVGIKEIRVVASKYSVCPYELSLSYAEICDVVICDVNYLFDPDVYIRRFFTDGGKFAFLIDEAHNLPERAREMFSAELSLSEISAPLDSTLIGEHSPLRALLCDSYYKLYSLLYSHLKEDIREDKDGKKCCATHLSEPPYELYSVFEELTAECENELYRSYSASDKQKSERSMLLRSLYLKFSKINRTLQGFDRNYKFFIFLEGENIRLKLFSVDTGELIRQRIEKGHGAVFFSATLSPMSYYRAALGADGSSEILELPSPFDSEQLSVSIMDKISTRYSERDRTLPDVCRVIAAALSAKRGKYMVFAPSYEYAKMIGESFSRMYPKIKVMIQKSGATQAEKDAFLAKFYEDGGGYLVGFCVLGGIFSEGIDLSGDSLIGAVVVGIGMPAISYERECMCEYYDEKYEKGKLFAYVYPGMNRVLQAAGRVIRREDDKGVIVLIDDRFDDPVYKKSIPDLWRGMRYIEDAKQLNARLLKFWNNNK